MTRTVEPKDFKTSNRQEIGLHSNQWISRQVCFKKRIETEKRDGTEVDVYSNVTFVSTLSTWITTIYIRGCFVNSKR
jgi:hypothetical protein